VVYHRYTIIVGCVVSVIAAIVTLAGIIVDGVAYGTTSRLDTCINQYNGELYGAARFGTRAAACAVKHAQTCLCVDAGNSDSCYLFDLQSAKNCGEILHHLPSLLLASVLFMILLFVFDICYSVQTCFALSAEAPEHTTPPVVAAPAAAPAVPPVKV
jgi:hypothetical protein